MSARAARLDRWSRALLAAALVVQCFALLVLGRFPNTDETFYKAAGREWAASGRFAAPELAGFTGTRPGLEEVFFAYPPLYPFLFGLAVKLCGFGWRVCVGYDALIHVALALATGWLARRRLPAAPAALACGAALLVVPLGTSGRPDELGMLFALVALGLLAGAAVPRGRELALSGAALGLAAGTSPGVAVMLGAQGALLVLASVPRRRARALLVWAACAAAVCAAVLAPVLLAVPEAYRQALGQSVLRERLSGFTLRLGDWRGSLPLLACIALLLTLGGVAGRARLLTWRAWASLFLVPGLALAALVVLLPGKHTYLWMWGPWLCVAALECVWRAWSASRQRLAVALALATCAACALATAPGLHRTLVLVSLPAEQRLDPATARVRASIPAGSRVLVDELWWSLADAYQVRDAAWWRPTNPAEVDWVVLSANGTGAPGRARRLPPALEAHVAEHFDVVRDDLNPRRASLFGLPLSRSGYGFGVRVLRRRGSPAAQ